MIAEELKRNIAKLSKYERRNPLIIIDENAYSPDQIVTEIITNTRVGAMVLESMTNSIDTSEIKMKNLALYRLKKLFTEKRIVIKTLLIDKPEITSEEMLIEIEDEESVLGQSLINTEILRMHRIYRILGLE